MEPLLHSVDGIRRVNQSTSEGLQVIEAQERGEGQPRPQLSISRQSDDIAQCAQFVSDGLQVEPQERCKEQQPLQLAFGRQQKEALLPNSDPRIGPDNAGDRGPHQEIHRTLINQKPTRRCIGVIVAVLVVILIAVLSPVLLLRSRRSNGNHSGQAAVSPVSNSTANITNNRPTDYFSTTGAFNGTGLVSLNLYNGPGRVLLIFQDYTGDVRSTRWSNDGVWQSPQSLGLQNVMNGTPLAGISYMINYVLYLQLFYIDQSGFIQNVVQTSLSNRWINRSLGNFPTQAAKEPGIRLLVIANLNSDRSGADMNLYAGGADGLIHEYQYIYANNAWTVGFTFPNTNGFAGISGSWYPSPIMNLVATNANGGLELWWKDTNVSATNSATHPVGEWIRGAHSTVATSPNTSVCSFIYTYYQDESGKIFGITTSNSAELQSWGTIFIVDGAPALPGTSITCQQGTASGNNVFFQTNGSNIVAYNRPDTNSGWKMTVIPLE